MKRTFLIITLLTTFLMGASPVTTRLVRLTIINKSGMPLEISLTGSEDEVNYYLRVAEGDRTIPVVTVFTIHPDEYQMRVYFVELWDPVYGATCDDTAGQRVDATHNVRVVVHPCKYTPPNGGEPPSMLKYGGRSHKRPR